MMLNLTSTCRITTFELGRLQPTPSPSTCGDTANVGVENLEYKIKVKYRHLQGGLWQVPQRYPVSRNFVTLSYRAVALFDGNKPLY